MLNKRTSAGVCTWSSALTAKSQPGQEFTRTHTSRGTPSNGSQNTNGRNKHTEHALPTRQRETHWTCSTNQVPKMLLYSVLCLCVLITLNGATAFSSLTKDELYLKISNPHMLPEKNVGSLINAQKSEIYEEYLARDCRAAYVHGRRRSGLYVIRPKLSSLFVVYCDMEYDGGGWTVLHRNNANKKSSWSRTWHDYKQGFGSLLGNHWLGNEFMHLLTRQNAFSVRFVITESNGEIKHADYSSFKVDTEHNGYALRLGNYSGDATDALTTMYETGIHDNMKFSTKDRDNDRRVDINCALNNAGGWWYDNCFSAVLASDNRIYWKGLCTDINACKLASIMIRPNGKNCNIPSRY
ncbi:fibrinogen-like protein 1-like protein [Hemicordylus capensis]|uniref:fibrinogen-like protein 1-like protein n=1 Tax=Hemicordylus capensis TaxID=884348 RepID=UPI0023035BA1|nr:fibrinogen-like protein 1-like protein [Hemicordylus capensis]